MHIVALYVTIEGAWNKSSIYHVKISVFYSPTSCSLIQAVQEEPQLHLPGLVG